MLEKLIEDEYEAVQFYLKAIAELDCEKDFELIKVLTRILNEELGHIDLLRTFETDNKVNDKWTDFKEQVDEN